MSRRPHAACLIACIVQAALLTGCINMPSDSDMVEVATPGRLEYAVGAGALIELDIPAGEVSVTGEDFAAVAGTLSVRCPRDSASCARWANEARLVAQQDGDRVRVALSSKPRSNVSVKVALIVPQDSPLSVALRYGELHISDVNDHVRAELKAGELRIAMPAAAVREAHLKARFGDASMSLGPRATAGRRPTLVGARVDWTEGTGTHAVDARVRYGDVQLELYD